jgi:hypothetical protein
MSAQRWDDLAFSKMRRRSLLRSASVRKEQPSSFALRLVMASDRFKATEARNAEAPEATIDFKRTHSETEISEHSLRQGAVGTAYFEPGVSF